LIYLFIYLFINLFIYLFIYLFIHRFPSYASSVASQVWFGTKRVITVHNLERALKIDLVWGLAFPVLGKLYGYVPARKFKLGEEGGMERDNLKQTKSGIS